MIPENLAKATLKEISWDSNQDPVDGDHLVEVQFNPESLKLALSNQNASGDQRGGSAIQYVGAGTSKLSFDLWFDATEADGLDVRDLTNQVVFFMTPQSTDQEDKFIPPGVRFSWGSFLFEGIMDSLSEDLEFFSEDGRPLRAKLAIAMSRQEIRFEEGRQQGGSGLGTTAASGSNQQATDGNSVPDLTGDDWAPIAAANGIENPLDLGAGAVVDLSAGASLDAGLSIGAGVSAGASLDAGLSAGASFNAGAGASLGGGLRAGASAGAGIGGGLGGGVSGGFGTDIGGDLSAGFGVAESSGFGVDAGAGATSTAGASAGFGGAAASASASASASFDRKIRR